MGKTTDPNPRETRRLEGFFLCRELEDTPENDLEAVAEIIGILIGLKPASMPELMLTPVAISNLQTILSDLGLASLVEPLPYKDPDSRRSLCRIFISTKSTTALELRNTLHDWLALGYRPGDPEDQALTLKLGRLLGYPDTAVRHVAFGPRDLNGLPCRHPGSDRDRYYIHSPDHFRTEYRQFEDRLHPKLASLCPCTAQLMRHNQRRCWSSRDL